MSGDISIQAQLSVSTKAKLDEVKIGGGCDCGKKVVTVIVKDYVLVLDSSDSFGDSISGGNAFKKSEAWAFDFSAALAKKSPDSSFAIVNFAGVPGKEEYKAGSGGLCSHSAQTGMVHYRVEVAPGSPVSIGKEPIASMEPLDGNGQLWLCLQDMAHSDFLSKFGRKDTVIEGPTEIIRTIYETEMVIVTDDDWDLRGDKLLTTQGKPATTDSITALLHANYSRISMVIVRETDSNNNDAKINSLCKGRNTYNKAQSDSIDADFARATRNILA